MTIWASKSEFEVLFGDDWNVNIEEKDSTVTFIIKPNKYMEVNSRNIDRYISQFKATGCDEWKMFYNKSGFGFKAVYSRNKLLDDYDE